LLGRLKRLFLKPESASAPLFISQHQQLEVPNLAVGWENGTPTDEIGPPGDEYQRLFQRAIARSRQLGLYTGDFSIVSGCILNQGSIKRVQRALRRIIGLMLGGNSSHLAGQCFTVCSNLENALQGEFRFNPIVTLGGVYGFKGRMFGIDIEVLEAAVAQGAQATQESIDLHAWLTFPTGEIVDPTLLSTMAVKGYDIGVPSGLRKLVFGQPKNILNLRYEPLVIGSGLFDRLGMVRGWLIS